MRSFVGFARADEVETWNWGRYTSQVEEVLDEFERYLAEVLDDEEEVLDVVVLVKIMVRTLGFVPRPHELSKYYVRLGEEIASSDWLMHEFAKRYGFTAADWEAFFREFHKKQAERYARASALYYRWRDGL